MNTYPTSGPRSLKPHIPVPSAHRTRITPWIRWGRVSGSAATNSRAGVSTESIDQGAMLSQQNKPLQDLFFFFLLFLFLFCPESFSQRITGDNHEHFHINEHKFREGFFLKVPNCTPSVIACRLPITIYAFHFRTNMPNAAICICFNSVLLTEHVALVCP